ncbi:2-polyprenyl-3-methyl-6-methoxy-1,4-benzoquinone monooxygenase [Paucibacter sediminis]|uniref:3-demethoxyubiquinol 3-hydroxylase n=1 Tax=Paucibacter sediminis TaxID=3019553 RepID=A0AA95STW3_9BURK|nr:2-polyprenyl-3-methyl-6-methoxy-1,4-benzoquinone monooxygenase [Paucibacter sp. S2-9]WIT09814.1 2-polyprenyl-3-methyl-6-methoxy-1,4-benzoquinone monooxygenase [Paucibacter sp. S2-9]
MLDTMPRLSMNPAPHLNFADRLISSADHALRTMTGAHAGRRPSPAAGLKAELSDEDGQLAGALMRVNHVGEVCAQALYRSQALVTSDATLRHHFERAAEEEVDHLVWTRQRLVELNTHSSYLTPLWYAGAFGIGVAAGLLGDRLSLGFVVETERQVEAHLASHLDRLPAADRPSRAIVAKMQQEEAAHAEEAMQAGARELPAPVRGLMRLAARVMTRTAHHI